MMVGMLTTKDNPWDPFDHWKEWFAWDSKAGYHTSGLLARFLENSEELSEVAQQEIINEAIVKVAEDNFSGMHIAVWRDLPHPYPDV
jgi:hypothetical protein